MCFSASASFTAAGILCCIGYLTSTTIRKKEYWMVAAIPLLFALQQAAEGIVWLTMGNPDYQRLYMIAAYTFLVFALSVWPSWSPIALWQCEQDVRRKKTLRMLAALGLLVSVSTAFMLASSPLQVKVFNCSLWYSFEMIDFLRKGIGLLLYTIAAVGPFFVSSLPFASYLGGFLLVALFFTALFMYTTLLSVWCFFAALLSVFTYLILRLKFPR